jgi:hypothetical protein
VKGSADRGDRPFETPRENAMKGASWKIWIAAVVLGLLQVALAG